MFVQGKLISGKMSDFRPNSKGRKSSYLWMGVCLSNVRLIQMLKSDAQCSVLFCEKCAPLTNMFCCFVYSNPKQVSFQGKAKEKERVVFS